MKVSTGDDLIGERLAQVEHGLDRLDSRIDALEQKVDAKMDGMTARLDQFLAEMRDRDNQRHQEILEIRQGITTILASNRQIIWAVGVGMLAIGAAVVIADFFPLKG